MVAIGKPASLNKGEPVPLAPHSDKRLAKNHLNKPAKTFAWLDTGYSWAEAGLQRQLLTRTPGISRGLHQPTSLLYQAILKVAAIP